MGSKLTRVTNNNIDTNQQKPIFDITNKCNYSCPVCQKSGKTPNMAGKFFLINELECKCNACDTIFPKDYYYAKVIHNATPT